MTSSKRFVRFDKVDKSYDGKVLVVKDLNLDINEGEFITVKNVRRIRPGFGLEAKFYDDVIGAECLKSAKKGDRVTLEHFSKD